MRIVKSIVHQRLFLLTKSIMVLLMPMSIRVSAGETRLNKLDGNAIVHKMVATYQAAQTFQETTEVKMTRLRNGDFIQSTILKFKQPNRLFLSTTDPVVGTYQGYCDGKSAVVYMGAQNIYTTKRTSSKNLHQTVEELASLGKTILSFPMHQVLNPISFASAGSMPTECKQFRLLREETLEGKPAFVVRGQADAEWLLNLIPLRQIQYDHREINLWIDKSRYVLLKASCDISWHIGVQKTDKIPEGVASSGFRFVAVHRGIVFNGPIRDEDFLFHVPDGARDTSQE